MPKGKSLLKKNTGSTHPVQKNDFTIYDFAHRDIVISTVLRDRKVEQTNWRNISGDTKWVNNQLMSNPQMEFKSKTNSPRKKLEKKNCEEVDDSYSTIPLDIWFLIGCHIRPDDVATFACICLNTLLVARSATFWKRIYLRYYKETVDLPQCLEISNVERCHGIKGRVVRALHYFYEPFRSRLKAQQFGNGLEELVGRRCLQMWYFHDKNIWHYYFKFQKVNSTNISNTRKDKLQDADALLNEEESKVVLEVQSNQFLPLPSAHTLILIKISEGISHGLMANKLLLHFHSCFCKATKSALDNSLLLSLNPILRLHLLPWWHPKYPA